jgi:hypothetical protein
MTGTRVEVDTRELEAGLAQLMRGVDRGIGPVARGTAQSVAGRLRPMVPVRTGRLRATVTVTATSTEAAVHYGGRLPYAGYIDGRTGATARATEGAPRTFYASMYGLGAMEVRRL